MYEYWHNLFYDQDTFVMTLIGGFFLLIFGGVGVLLAMLQPEPPRPPRLTVPPLPPSKDLSQ